MLKAIFWDNDGVLVDTEVLYFQSSKEILSEVGVELIREDFVRISLTQGKSVFDLAAERGIDQNTISQLQDKRNRRYREMIQDGVPVMDGVKDTLRQLHGKVVMGIVTSCRKEHFEIIHAKTELLPYFDFVLTRQDYQRSKPSPEPYLTAIQRNGFKPQECVVVEDSVRGLEAAKAAGIHCIVVPNGLTRNGNFSGAYKVCDDVREVASEVLKLLE